jgi:hypothetical protein
MRQRLTAGRILALVIGVILLAILAVVLLSIGTDSGFGS